LSLSKVFASLHLAEYELEGIALHINRSAIYRRATLLTQKTSLPARGVGQHIFGLQWMNSFEDTENHRHARVPPDAREVPRWIFELLKLVSAISIVASLGGCSFAQV
jgi:hypothetical protein